MVYYCTLFDSNYLSRGLLLYESLERVIDNFHIYIIAFDDVCHRILISLDLKKATVIKLEDFENEELLRVKKERTRAEYCWTCTSSVLLFVLDNFKLPCCTYVDADLYFYDSPNLLESELNKTNKSVLITEHGYSFWPRLLEEKRAGRFCVQYITFLNNSGSRKILENWVSQCIEWCYDRYEDGKFGDQKYLDEWPERYDNVKIVENPGAGVAPWNINGLSIKNEGSNYFVSRKGAENLHSIVFFHFHFVRFYNDGSIDLGWNRLSPDIKRTFYLPYIIKLIEKERILRSNYDYYRTGYSSKALGLKSFIKNSFKKISGFNLLHQSDLVNQHES